MRRHTFMRSAFLFTTVFAFAACGDDDDNGTGPGNGNGEEIGELDAEVSGLVDETVTGGALIFVDADGSWTLAMGEQEDEDGSAIWFGGEGGRPTTGTHTFDLDSDWGAFYIHGPSGDLYLAEEGVLTVTHSSSSRLAGSFEFTAAHFEGTGDVTVEGSFDAVDVDTEL